MTNEKVIEILQEIKCDFENKCCSSIDLGDIEAIGLAIQALEYRTPKKAIEDNLSYSGYKCPICKCNIIKTRSHKMENTPFCIWCGQALDWT